MTTAAFATAPALGIGLGVLTMVLADRTHQTPPANVMGSLVALMPALGGGA